MIKYLLVSLIFFLSSSLFALDENTAENIMQEANIAYAENDFNRASILYDSLLSLGYFSADLHYNLGNALYKQNRIANAILHYEKALKMEPGMEDAKHNLQLANLKTVDKIEPIPDLFIKKWWKTIINTFNADEWATFAVCFLFFSLLGMAIYFFAPLVLFKKVGFYLAIIFVIISLFSWFFGGSQYYYLQNSSEAIIITPTINVNSSPTAGSTKLFVLHQGTKVDLKDESGEWVKIRIPNGNEGWMRYKDIAEI